MIKKVLCLASVLFFLGLIAGCGKAKPGAPPESVRSATAEENRRQQEEAGMMREAKESIQRMRGQTLQSPEPAEQ